jgi:hypothetical protein
MRPYFYIYTSHLPFGIFPRFYSHFTMHISTPTYYVAHGNNQIITLRYSKVKKKKETVKYAFKTRVYNTFTREHEQKFTTNAKKKSEQQSERDSQITRNSITTRSQHIREQKFTANTKKYQKKTWLMGGKKEVQYVDFI